jgi:hypothetical protein
LECKAKVHHVGDSAAGDFLASNSLVLQGMLKFEERGPPLFHVPQQGTVEIGRINSIRKF